jgi:hypothetical protein
MNKIELNAQETEWVNTLGTFEISLSEDYEKRISKLETADLLARSLLSRSVIPEVRFNYFTKPEYNLSNPKKSHEEIFESNGTKGEEILSHPHFLSYLKYFIYGAELPGSLKSELAALKENHSYDDDFTEEAAPIIKKYFKSFGSERTAFAEEVFKLCLDLNVPLAYGKLLRDKVMSWR